MKDNERIAARDDRLGPLEPMSLAMQRRAMSARRLQSMEERRDKVRAELEKIEERAKALERKELPAARQALDAAEAELDAARRARNTALDQYSKLRHRATALRSSAKILTGRLTQMNDAIKALRKESR